MTHTIFIDGEEGTTGLQIRERIESRAELDLIHLTGENRKDTAPRISPSCACPTMRRAKR